MNHINDGNSMNVSIHGKSNISISFKQSDLLPDSNKLQFIMSNNQKQISNENTNNKNNKPHQMKLYFKNANNQLYCKDTSALPNKPIKTSSFKQYSANIKQLFNQENEIHNVGELMDNKVCLTHRKQVNSSNLSLKKENDLKHKINIRKYNTSIKHSNNKDNINNTNTNSKNVSSFNLFDNNSLMKSNTHSYSFNKNDNYISKCSFISKLKEYKNISNSNNKEFNNIDQLQYYQNVDEDITNNSSKVLTLTKNKLSCKDKIHNNSNRENMLQIRKPYKFKKDKKPRRQTFTVDLEKEDHSGSLQNFVLLENRNGSENKCGENLILRKGPAFKLKLIKKINPPTSINHQQQRQQQPQIELIKSNVTNQNSFPFFGKHAETGSFRHLNHNTNNDSENSSDNSYVSNHSSDFIEEDLSKPNIINKEGPVYTINDIHAKTLQNQPEDYFNDLIHRYLFKHLDFCNESDESSSDDYSDELNIDDVDSNRINYCLHNNVGKLHRDIEILTNTKKELELQEQYYQKEIQRMKYELNKQLYCNNKLILSNLSSNNCEQDGFTQRCLTSTTTSHANGDDDISYQHQSFNQSIIQRELNYKETLKSLLAELNLSVNTSSSNSLNENKSTCDNALLQEVYEFLSQGEAYLPENSKNKNDNSSDPPFQKQSTKMINSFKQKSSFIRKDIAKELIQELIKFKKEEALYKFEIPFRYHMSNCVKCIKEKALKKKLIKIYENKVFDIIDKNNTIRRIFPDSYEIIFYRNKDIQQRFPNGQISFYYHINKSCEFRYMNEGFWVLKFPNGQYEKHYTNNNTDIKFENGSYRIIRPNEGELVMTPNGAVVIQDKNGKVLRKENKLPKMDWE